MATHFSQVGSGTIPFVRGILNPDNRGFLIGGDGIKGGTQVILGNPEDLLSVDAFAASGVTVSTAVVELVGPLNNPLPRCREIVVENVGGADVYLSHSSSFTTQDSFELSTEGTAGRSSRIHLPFLHNVSLYAKTAAGSTSVRLLIL